jgi:hypothetical protein
MVATVKQTIIGKEPQPVLTVRGGVREIREILHDVLAQYDLQPQSSCPTPRDERRLAESPGFLIVIPRSHSLLGNEAKTAGSNPGPSSVQIALIRR